jgi:group I intron endonuclease
MGEIYLIRSPSYKTYVGQTIYDYSSRWRDHCYDAFDPKKDHCKKLNRAIRKYGKESFHIELILKCETIEELNKNEDRYIRIFNSIKDGYNIKEGGKNGKHSEATKIKIGNAVRDIPKPDTMRFNLSKTRNTAGLPMYVIKHPNGYRVVNHPNQKGRERKITSRQIPDNVKLEMALAYLDKCNKNEL